MLKNEIVLITAIGVVVLMIVKLNNKKGNKRNKKSKKINNEGFMSSLPEYSSSQPVVKPATFNTSVKEEDEEPVQVYKKQENPLDAFFYSTMRAENDTDYNGVNYRYSDNKYAPVNGAYTLGVDLKNDPAFKEVAEMTVQHDQLVSADLLPKEKNDWFETPSVNMTIEDANLLADSEYRAGVNTTHSTLKSANLDIRGNIPVPKITVSPWNNSSRDFDNNIQSWCE